MTNIKKVIYKLYRYDVLIRYNKLEYLIDIYLNICLKFL